MQKNELETLESCDWSKLETSTWDSRQIGFWAAQGGRFIVPLFSGLAKRDREKKREGKGGQTRKIKGKAKKMTIGWKIFEKRSFFMDLERLPSIYYPEPSALNLHFQPITGLHWRLKFTFLTSCGSQWEGRIISTWANICDPN